MDEINENIRMLIIKHSKVRLKTINCALANNIKDDRLMKTRGELLQILKTLKTKNNY